MSRKDEMYENSRLMFSRCSPFAMINYHSIRARSNTWLRKILSVISLLSLLVAGVAYGQQPAIQPFPVGTFSSFEFNKEGGDLNGIEIRLILTRKGLRAVVQFAEGGAGDVAVVDVKVSGSRVAFELPSGFEVEGRFEGVVTSRNISGTFTYKGDATEKVLLKRKQSYWDIGR